MAHFALRLFAAALALIAAAAHAQSTRPKTCLVLGGGGARGAAHIGVLEVLERERVPIDCITGTSMGAVVGGLYAAGYRADEIDGILRGIDWKDVLQDDPPREDLPMRRKDDEVRFLGGIELGLKDGAIALPRGAIQGQKLQLLLRRLLLSTTQTTNFDDLPIPFRSVATNIGTGEKVVFKDGDLAVAIRASMSVPAAFAPIRVNGHLLVDGGIVDNVPVDVAREIGGQRLIVVNVGESLTPEDQLNSPFAIANQMLTAMMKRVTDAELATLGPDDTLLTPALGDFSSASFDESPKAVAIGVDAAERNLDALRRYAVGEAEYAHFTAAHHRRNFDPPLIAFLDVLHTRSRSAGYVEQHLSDVVGQPFDPARLEKDIGVAYGEGSYERITYEIIRRDDAVGLSVLPVDKGWGPNFLRIGLRLSDNFDGRSSYQLITEANFTGLNSLGGESRNRFQLGQINELYSEFLQPFGERGQFYVAPQVQYKAYNFPLNSGQSSIDTAEYRRSRYDGALELGWAPSQSWQLSGAIEYGHDDVRLRVGETATPNVSSDFGGFLFRFVFDNLDSSAFPTRGTRVDASQEELLAQLGSTGSSHITHLRWDTALSFGSNHFLVGGAFATSTGVDNALQIATFSPLGGLTNLSGYAESQLFGQQTGLLRAVYYHRLTDAQALFSVPVYLGGSLEAGGVWQTRHEIGTDAQLAGSLFLGVDTLFGPIFLGYGYAQGGHSAAYLTFGSLLRTDQ